MSLASNISHHSIYQGHNSQANCPQAQKPLSLKVKKTYQWSSNNIEPNLQDSTSKEIGESNDNQIENQAEKSKHLQIGVFKDRNDFKRQNIQWNNFILVYNPKSNANNLFCGNCCASFENIAYFIYHCLGICGKTKNCLSSHFIIHRKALKIESSRKPLSIQQKIMLKNKFQWQINKKQKIIQKQQEIKSQQIIEVDEKQQNIEKLINENSDIKMRQFEFLYKKIYLFTKQKIKIWKKSKYIPLFIFNQHYFMMFNLILIVNFDRQNYLNKKVKLCSNCKIKYNNQQIWLLSHFYQRHCLINNQKQSQLYILNASLYYEYLYKVSSNRFILSQKVQDFSYIAYLYDSEKVRKQIDQKYPYYKYFHHFIKIYYHLYTQKKLVCQICKYQYFTFKHQTGKYRHQIDQNHTPLISLTSDKKLGYKKYVCLHFYTEELKNEYFSCQCYQYAQNMAYAQFLTHLKKFHSQRSLNIILTKFIDLSNYN